MAVKSEKVKVDKQEDLVDDISKANISKEEKNMSSDENLEVNEEEGVDREKLMALKQKAAKKNAKKEAPTIVEEKNHSIKFGVIGSGQAGSRLSESMFSMGYNAVAINTAQQDLEHINIPESNKLLLDHGLGGASKELSIGRDAAEAYRDNILQLIHNQLGDAQVLLFCTSLGGGSGAGSAETIVDILSTQEKPVVVMTILPMSNEDAQTKSNALQTLKVLADAAQHKKIHNLIVVDNAKIETIYADVGQFEFFSVSNKAIVEPIDAFNVLSSKPSPVKGLDPMEFAKIFTDGEGLTAYGQMTVPNYEDETALAEAVIENLDDNLLSGGFDLKQAKYVGVIFAAPKSVWDKVPAGSVNYAMAMVNDTCESPEDVFKGIYEVDSDEDVIKVYSMFSGLSLPKSRVEQLRKDAQELAEKNKAKSTERNLSLKLDTGVEENVSAADKIRQKIKSKSSAFGKLTNSAVRDRRKG